MSILRAVTDFIPTSWLLPIAGFAGAALFATVGVQTVRLHMVQVDFAKESAAWAKQRAELAEAARQAEAEYREKERVLGAANERIRHDRDEDQRRNGAVVTALRAGDAQLRSAIAAYAAGGGGAAADSLAACQQRATSLGQLLEESLRLQVDLASAAEDRLADARRLREWADTLVSR